MTPRNFHRFSCRLAVALSGVAVSAGTAWAIPSYSYETDVAGIGPGQSVNVYLRETLQPGDTSLITQYGGLAGAGFAVRYLGGVGSINLVTITGNPALFDPTSFTVTRVSPTLATVVEAPSLFGSFPVPVGGRILLGTVTVASTSTGLPAVFSVGPITTGSTTTSIGTPTGGWTVTDIGPGGNLLDLDLVTAGVAYTPAVPTNFAVITLVPEPTALGLLAPIGALLLRRR